MATFITFHLLIAAVVTVTAEIEMAFKKWPESVTAPVGDVVTFECTVRVPGERLAWRWRPLHPEDGPWLDLPSTGDDKVSSRLAVDIKEDMQAGYYQCVVWYGAVSLASVPGRLTVARVELSRNSPEKRVITAPARNSLALHCKPPISDPPAVLTWWKESKEKKTMLETPHGVLVLNNVTSDDSGVYYCTATNELSAQTMELPERTVLRVQHEGQGGVRFLESEAYVGTVDREGTLTAPVQPNDALRLWCGVVGTPQPPVVWSRVDRDLPPRTRREGEQLVISPLKPEDQGIYTCTAGGLRRSWKVLPLEPAHWEGSANSFNGSEGGGARVSCGEPRGVPVPHVYWLLNALPITNDPSIRTTASELIISRVEKRHAGIVQCFACNELGCAYDAALLTVVPVQISDQEYSAEAARNMHFPPQPPRRHNGRKAHRKNVVLVPPSRPNVTRLSDQSVMLSWSTGNQGLPIQFFKVQYRQATNSSSAPWHTESTDIPPYIHSYKVNGLTPDRYYKFRISAVYSNQDNAQGRISSKFYLQRGGSFRSPAAPTLDRAAPLSTTTIQLNWTWSSNGGVQAEGFYVWYRAVASAGEYEKVAVPGGAAARSAVLTHLAPDTAYEAKLQAYTAQAPSDFSSILSAKTLRVSQASTTTAAPTHGEVESGGGGGGTLATAGGAGAGLIAVLVIAVLLCRRARRMHRNTAYKEKQSVPEGGGTNGYIPGKVPITITANPMHGENGDSGVEMSYVHNNNTGSEEDTLPHSRKNGVMSRQYV